ASAAVVTASGPAVSQSPGRHQRLAAEGEWVLDSITRGYLAPADWLRGELVGAERALSSSIGEPRAAGGRDPGRRGTPPRACGAGPIPRGHHRAPLWLGAVQCQAGGCGRFHRHLPPSGDAALRRRLLRSFQSQSLQETPVAGGGDTHLARTRCT